MTSPGVSSTRLGGSNLAAHAGTIFTMFAWGTLVPAADVVLREVDAWTLAAIRVVAAAAILLLASIGLKGGAWLRRVPVGRILLLGAGVAGFSVFYTLGIALSNPVSAIIVSATGPVVSAIFAAIVIRERMPRGSTGAFGLAMLGAIIASLADRHESSRIGVRGGESLLLLGSLCWTWYSIKAQHWLGDLGQYRVTTLSYIGAAIVLAVLYALMLTAGVAAVPRNLPSHSALALLLWIIFAVTLVGGVLWNYGVSRIGIIPASLYLNLVPLFGILTAAAFGSYPSWAQVIGCVLVVLGVALLRRSPAAVE